MKKHSGMRPHDIVILLKIASKGSHKWFMKDLAYELEISASEISESINRSVISGLISGDKKTLKKMALLDFLRSGLRYVYPQQPGALMLVIDVVIHLPRAVVGDHWQPRREGNEVVAVVRRDGVGQGACPRTSHRSPCQSYDRTAPWRRSA